MGFSNFCIPLIAVLLLALEIIRDCTKHYYHYGILCLGSAYSKSRFAQIYRVLLKFPSIMQGYVFQGWCSLFVAEILIRRFLAA